MPAENTDNEPEMEISKAEKPADGLPAEAGKDTHSPKEIGGRGGLDPTRYGDWEKAGRCIDF
jgi:hypothetical protein